MQSPVEFTCFISDESRGLRVIFLLPNSVLTIGDAHNLLKVIQSAMEVGEGKEGGFREEEGRRGGSRSARWSTETNQDPTVSCQET